MSQLLIEREIETFRILCKEKLPKSFDVKEIINDGYCIQPRNFKTGSKRSKQFDLTLLGLIHGNEFGGCAVLNRFLDWLAAGVLPLNATVAVALGNPPAALQNVRFRERDLNRSFERDEAVLFEEKRADEIESILSETAFLLDFHQTREKSLFPFFISPFQSKSFRFAAEISKDFPIITHWGKPFSGEGRCTDEFVNRKGGVGMTLELGQNGLDLRQIAAGVQASCAALHAAERELGYKTSGRSLIEDGSISNEIYTWAQTVPCDDPDAYVDAGFHNFAPVKKGQRIGVIRDKTIVAEVDGCILFPKYNDHNQANRMATSKMEFCRIIKRIGLDDLPEKI